MSQEKLVQEIIEEQSGREDAGAVIRWALIAEVLEPGDTNVTVDICGSDNLETWQLAGFAWALQNQAESAHRTRPYGDG